MPTQCSADLFGFAPVDGRRVEAGFDGGTMTSDAGALLLGATDRVVGLVGRLAGCFVDARRRDLIEHDVATLIGQRVFGIALGYEDLNDHEHLRYDPAMAVLAGKLGARRSDCAPVAGKSTLNRLELSRPEPTRYHKIAHDEAAIERLFVELFLEAHANPPKQIVLDLDATDDPVHGHQEGRFFHGYYDGYCYLPLYVFCGRHLLSAKLRRSNIDASAGAVAEVERIVARIRTRWPRVRILLRADSGFAREALMAWCEKNRVDYVFGLARNDRLVEEIAVELIQAEEEAARTGKPARRFKDLRWSTRESWSRRRRVIAKAEWTQGEANPRFIVTSLKPGEVTGRHLRRGLLREGRYGKPHQGDAGRSVRGPDLGRHHAGEPAQAMVRLDGLRAHVRAAPHRAPAHPVCRGCLRHDPAQAAQARGTRPRLGQAGEVRYGVGLPVAERMGARPRPIAQRRRCLRAALNNPATKEIIVEPAQPPTAVGNPCRPSCRPDAGPQQTPHSSTPVRYAG